MKKLKRKLVNKIDRIPLATQIRISYMVPIVPIVILYIFTYVNYWYSNREYGDMINSVVKASEFSLDFKQEFDYETYMVIVGQLTYEESRLEDMIDHAGGVLDELSKLTSKKENKNRIELIGKYLANLNSYISTIEQNTKIEGTYDENMQIWENDVQVGTALLQETVYQYTYYEVKQLEEERNKQQKFYTGVATASIVAFVVVGLMILFVSYYHNRLLRKVREEQTQLRKAEFMVLQSQINPHFLYNTLDAITWLAESGNRDLVVSMVGSLSDFFRASLNQGKDIVSVGEDAHHVRSYLEIQKVRYQDIWDEERRKDIVSVGEDAHHVRSYLEIQKVRYQDILDYEINIDKEYENVSIPKITIQPLVENAIYHGIKNKRGGGKIIIDSYVEGHALVICVKDNGAGMSKDRLKQVREGITRGKPEEKNIYGLYNVNERIRLHFGDKYGISIESEEGVGTKAYINLPIVKN